jgi:hypothetical protein
VGIIIILFFEMKARIIILCLSNSFSEFKSTNSIC